MTSTVYNNGSGGAASGAKPGDSKPSKPGGGGSGGDPAPGGTTGSPPAGGDDGKKKDDGTSATGGGDCSNPPAVSGSPALGMVAMQTWRTRCASEQLHTDLVGDGKSDPGDITKPSGLSAWVDTPSTGDGVADNANKGIYDTSGMGFGTTCPMHDLDVALWDGRSFAIPFSKGCEVGMWIRMFVLAFAAFACAKITAGGRG